MCQTGDGFITTDFDLTSVEVRPFNFTNQGVLTEGRFRITDTQFQLNFQEDGDFNIAEPVMNRIPENLVW